MAGGAAPHVPLLEAREIEKSFGAVRALRSGNLRLDRGEVVGLVGANGAGKSTLIKTLTGVVAADAGQILVDGQQIEIRHPDTALRAGLVAVPQELVLAADHSISENVFLGRLPGRMGIVNLRGLRRRARAIMERVTLDADPDTPVGGLTPVEQRLVMVAAALAKEARVLILDEPTAALPKAESEVVLQLVRQLSSEGTAIIYVSHRLYEVQALASRCVIMRDGRTVDVLEGDEVTEERMLHRLTGGAEFAEEAVAAAHRDGKVILDVRELCGPRVQDVSLSVRAGEVLGIAGLAGAGRSELLRLLYGIQRPSGGTVHYQGELLEGAPRARVGRGVGYITERRRANTLPGMSVKANVSVASLYRHSRALAFIDPRWESRAVAQISERVSMVGAPSAAIETLSGGNQQKALIARWLVRGVDLLLLDEPTAGIDLRARAEIHHLLRQLAQDGATILIASVEPEELVLVCDRVIVLVEGRVSAEMTAPFDEERLVVASYGARAATNGQTHA